jgi:hypothetical protein
MKSADPDERARGYERLIELVKAAPNKLDLLETGGNVASGCLALEPDEAAVGRLRSALFVLLPASDAPLPAQPEQYEACYWAAETAVNAIHRANITDDRRRDLVDALSAALSHPFDPAADRTTNIKTARARTSLLAFQQLTAAAARQPAAVAVLHEHVADRAARQLTEEELTKAETTLLSAALPAAGKDWHAYEAAISRCVSSPDSLDVLRLTDALARCTDEELVESLSRMLVLRAGVRPDSWSKSDVVKAVRKTLGATSPSAASSAADRWLALREQAETALARPAPAMADERELLGQTVELAHLATMAIALAQGDAGYATFDAGMKEPPALAAPGKASEGTGPRATPASARSTKLGASDRRDLERFSTMLGGHARMQPVQRVIALRGLASVGEAAADISPQQAENIAKYLLAAKADDEHAEVVLLVSGIRHWKRLRLAVADFAAHSKLTAAQQERLAAALLGLEVASGSADAGNLRQTLMESVLADLSESAAGTGDPQLVLDEAAELLADIYRQRARLFSIGGPALQSAESPSSALDLSLRPLAESLRGSGDDAAYLANLDHVYRAAQFVGEGNLRRTAAFQRMAVELSARRVIRQRPQHAAAARQIDAESLAAISAADNVLRQLREQEAALLKLWLLYAPEI